MAIDWTQPVCTKAGTPHIGRRLSDCPTHGKKRVAIFSPSAIGRPTNDEGKLTVFRYTEDGHARGGAGPSPNDLVNYDPADGAVRLDLNGRTFVCDGQVRAA